MPFYARYPATIAITGQTETVQGSGTAGTPAGGVLTIQGNPSGTPVPISGNITASNAAVGPTGAAPPSSADYQGYNVAGVFTGATGTANGQNVVINAAIPAGANSIGTVVLGAGAASVGTVINGAGSAIIGKVGIDQTTPGTTNGVQVVAALPAGANSIGSVVNAAGAAIIGKVGIDQTTPGTTNGVQVNAALPAGANSIGTVINGAGAAIIGKVGIDQTTPGTTNAVAVTSSVQPTATTAVFQAEGAVAFGSITGTYATLFTPSASTKILQMRNNTNAAVSVSFDAGTTTNYTLDSGDAVSLDLFTNGLIMPVTAIQVKFAVGAPTTGSFRINGGH